MRGVAAFVVSGRHTTHKCYNLYSTVEILTSDDTRRSSSDRCQSLIGRFSPSYGSLSKYCYNVWYQKKTRIMWLTYGENFF